MFAHTTARHQGFLHVSSPWLVFINIYVPCSFGYIRILKKHKQFSPITSTHCFVAASNGTPFLGQDLCIAMTKPNPVQSFPLSQVLVGPPVPQFGRVACCRLDKPCANSFHKSQNVWPQIPFSSCDTDCSVAVVDIHLRPKSNGGASKHQMCLIEPTSCSAKLVALW